MIVILTVIICIRAVCIRPDPAPPPGAARSRVKRALKNS
jgi:hypothetical protein